MAEESFKKRVCFEIIKAAAQYKSTYVDYEYLICSEAFRQNKYYIVTAKEDNFQHLTGVHSNLSAQEFFDKCMQKTLSEQDFDFIKYGQDEKSVKGTVRRKIKVLPNMMELFREGLEAEESFVKNKVICSFATTDNSCTLGFSDSKRTYPKSLIQGNCLKNPKAVELILRRKSGEKLFNEVVVGNPEDVKKFQEHIKEMVSKDLSK